MITINTLAKNWDYQNEDTQETTRWIVSVKLSDTEMDVVHKLVKKYGTYRRVRIGEHSVRDEGSCCAVPSIQVNEYLCIENTDDRKLDMPSDEDLAYMM